VLRKFEIPKDINFNADALSEVSRTALKVEPALTRKISIEELRCAVLNQEFQVPYLCHSQVNIKIFYLYQYHPNFLFLM
jgi:hypothetical protein